MTLLLCALFFLSGVSALTFETLWFHQAGLALGNSVWASSLVLAGFMGGLGLGNGLAAWHGDRIANAVRAYAVLEVVIGVTGVALVYVLPALSPLLAAAAGPLAESRWALNALRFSAAFVLLLAPSTAMGLTLPLLTKALAGARADFGSVLGRLYGWNTLGAVLGAVAAETLWIGSFGIRGTAWAAGLLNLLAAAGAALLAARIAPAPAAAPERPDFARRALPGVAAAFTFGFLLLALEVVWFRFLSLYVFTHTVAFALMLGVVLTGIALGGLAGGRLLRSRPAAHRLAGPLALASAALCVVCYAVFPTAAAPYASAQIRDASTILLLSGVLMLPVSLLSGALFTLVGAGLREHFSSEARTTGALTLANTAGAALGALMAGFVLLPGLGIETTLFWLAAGYALTGLWLGWSAGASRGALAAGLAAGMTSLVLFPSGAMLERILPSVRQRVSCPQLVAVEGGELPALTLGCDVGPVTVREGLVETIQYVEHRRLGNPYYYRLVTDSYSMSGTLDLARRYMKLYVYLPAALHPDLESALVISFGVGSTAKALVDTPGIERIDVVDISPEILMLSAVVYPGEDNPLADPRVKVHVEDGRYFLQTTGRRFDLVTGEPPPPGAAGVVNLYTREYFELVRERLNEGGIASYWLPMHSLSGPAALSIVRAFCEAFDDCSLWNGSGSDLMLLGTRGPAGEPSVDAFVRQWREARARPELEALGFERPEQLGALFVGDAMYLRELTRDTQPLLDDRPKRVVAPESDEQGSRDLQREWRDVEAARERFEASAWIAERFPEELRSKALDWFPVQRILHSVTYGLRHPDASPLDHVHELLTSSPLRTPVLWLLGSDSDLDRMVETATRPRSPQAAYYRGVGLLSRREFEAAATILAAAEQSPEQRLAARILRIYALELAGQHAEAQRLTADLGRGLDPWLGHRTWTWLESKFGLDLDSGSPAGGTFELSPEEQAVVAALPCRALAGHISPACWLPVALEAPAD